MNSIIKHIINNLDTILPLTTGLLGIMTSIATAITTKALYKNKNKKRDMEIYRSIIENIKGIDSHNSVTAREMRNGKFISDVKAQKQYIIDGLLKLDKEQIERILKIIDGYEKPAKKERKFKYVKKRLKVEK